MAILNLTKIKTPKSLARLAKRDLENQTLSQIANWIAKSDSSSRISTKAGVGHVIEEGYFGIKKIILPVQTSNILGLR